MKSLSLLFLLLTINNLCQAQWKNRYPKVDGFGHHVYLEGYELPIMNAGAIDPAPSPDNTTVVFAAKGWLWLYTIETGVANRITTTAGVDSSPNWSPDGKAIVFVRDNSLDMQLVLLDLPSGKETVLVDTERLEVDPIFSPSGESVYYSSAKNGSFDLWKINLATKEKTNLTTASSLERLPTPTADGKSLVYLKKEGFSYDAIIHLDLEENIATPIVEENFTSQADFSMSPNSETLVYTWPNGDDYELRLVNSQKPETRMLLTKSKGLPLSPKFSSDGNWVYFSEYNNNEQAQMMRIAVGGGEPENLQIKQWNWGVETGTLTIKTKVDGQSEAARLSILDSQGHPIVPVNSLVHSEGQNGRVFFYSPGEITVQAPVGEVMIMAVHGFETPLHKEKVMVKDGSNETELNLTKIWDAEKAGWYSADNHFHLNYGGTNRLVPEDILVDLDAEDIDVAFPLVANLGNRFLEQDLMKWQYKGNKIVEFGQETRSHFFGHLNILGTQDLFWPWVWGPYYDIYDEDDRVNAEALQFARERGAVSGYVHPVSVREPFANTGRKTVPNGFIADAVLEQVDLLEVGCLWSDEIGTAALWHEFLNLGIPIAQSAGSDVMNDLYRTMAIGASRVYVKPEGELTKASFLEGLKNGRSFVSTGPQILFTVDGQEPGDILVSKKKKAKWQLDVYSPVQFETIELFVNGEVVWSRTGNGEQYQSYKGSISIPEGGWVTARVSGGKSEWPMMDSYPFAESSPIWFSEIGSTMPESKQRAAKKLLATFDVSTNIVMDAYQGVEIPKIKAHFKKAKEKLQAIARGEE